MGEGFEIEGGERGAAVRYRTPGTVQGIVRAAEALAAHTGFRPSMPTIWDLSAAPDANLGADDMRRLAPLVAGMRKGGGRPRVAIVTSSDATFAGARMFTGLNEGRLYVDLGVFRTFEEAADWAFETPAEQPGSDDAG